MSLTFFPKVGSPVAGQGSYRLSRKSRHCDRVQNGQSHTWRGIRNGCTRVWFAYDTWGISVSPKWICICDSQQWWPKTQSWRLCWLLLERHVGSMRLLKHRKKYSFFFLIKKKWLKGKPSRSLGIDSQHIKILEWLPNNQFLQAFTIPWDTVETSMELWEEFIQEDHANELQLLWQAWKIRGEAPDRARQLQKSFCPPLALSQAET